MRKPAFRNLVHPFTEEHHVVPRAWQAAWIPGHGHPTIAPVGWVAELWHPETVPLEASAHRWVHVIIDFLAIVEHQYHEPTAELRALYAEAPGKRTRIHTVARHGIEEFLAAGGPPESMGPTR